MKRLLVFIELVIFSTYMYAQETSRSITGIVTDGEQPIRDVNVDIANSNSGTTTDSLGRFKIDVNRRDVLQFTHVGMFPIKLRAKRLKDSAEVKMRPVVERLEEVIVKGKAKSRQKLWAQEYPTNYNIIRSKFGYIHQDRTAYTMRIIKGDQFFKGAGNFLQVLRVHFPQIRITREGIFLRPNSSFRNSQTAAFELDGMFLTSVPNEITVSEIDRIAVISSSSITARYGAAASGGIIIINTKGSHW